MQGWSLVALLIVVMGGAIYFYRQARKSGKQSQEIKVMRAADKAEEDQDEKDRIFDRIDDDDALSERMRAVREAESNSDAD